MKVHQRPVGQVVKTAASHAVNIGSNPVRVTRRRSKVRFAPAVFLRQIPTVGSETCGVFVQYRGTAGRRPGTVAAARRGGPDSTGHTGSAPAVPPAGGDTRQIFACHCEERSDVAIRSPAVAQSKEQRLRRIRESAYGFARSSTGLSSFTAGMRIATPVCALARNDMQKTEACQRLQGRGAQ